MFQRYSFLFVVVWVASLLSAIYAGYQTLAYAIVFSGFVAGLIADHRREKRQEREFQAMREEFLSDEGMLKSQLEFEKRIEQQIGLPDAITGHQIYIYRNLMKVWLNELAARLQYHDEEKLNKIKADFLRYIQNVESRASYHFLSLEGKSSKKDKYELEHYKAWELVKAIEDRFAFQVGQNAIEELNYIRELPNNVFNDYGNKAPEGHYYEIGRQDGKLIKYLRQK